jgi:hypothetical protein
MKLRRFSPSRAAGLTPANAALVVVTLTSLPSDLA